MTDTLKLRKLINRVDAIMRNISLGVYENQEAVRATLKDALQKTGAWVH